MRKFLSKKVLANVLLMGAIGVGITKPASAEIPIGVIVSSTGMASFLGEPQTLTLKLLVDEINKNGGVLGEEIKLYMYDDAGDANKARTFATRLIEDNEVVAIIGGTVTGTTMAIAPLVEEEEIPFVSLAGAVEIIDPVKKYVFKTPHTDRMACAKIFEDMQKRDFTKIGLISGTDSFGSSMRRQCNDIADGYGLEIVGDEVFNPGDADMTPQLTNLKNKSGIQAILNLGLGAGPAIVTRNYSQLAIDLPLYQSHGVASDEYIKLAGAKPAQGVRLPGTYLLIADLLEQDDPQYEVVNKYKKQYEESTGISVSTFGGYAYDALALVVDGIQRAGKAEPAAIRDALESTKGLISVTGTYTMSPTDHLGLDLSAFKMLEIDDGKWTIIK